VFPSTGVSPAIDIIDPKATLLVVGAHTKAMFRRLLEFSGGSVTAYSRAAKFRDVAPNNLASLLVAILAWLLRWKLIA
jgi:hypothetical protein